MSSPASFTPMCWPGYNTDSRATYLSSVAKYKPLFKHCVDLLVARVCTFLPISFKVNSEYGPPFP